MIPSRETIVKCGPNVYIRAVWEWSDMLCAFICTHAVYEKGVQLDFNFR